MSFLTPLFLAGLVAFAVPLILHLIRRMPRNRRTFSSLMFLAPSPPRLTRKSRLENPLLLALRIAAVVMLAAAFARPFLRERAESAAPENASRRVAIIVDRSASMRRETLWQQAIAKVDAVLESLTPLDDVALFASSDRLERLVPFNAAASVDVAEHRSRIRARMREITPTWGASDLGAALVSVADELNEASVAGEAGAAGGRQIVLVGDLGCGSRLDALQGYEWPPDVAVSIELITARDPTNAGLSIAAGELDGDEGLRVRVTNDRDSAAEEFSLRWASSAGPVAGREAVVVTVPPGETRVSRLGRPPGEGAADRIILGGDAHDFDNTVYVAPIRQETVPIVYVGDDDAADAQGLLYYLMRAFPATARRAVAISARKPADGLRASDRGEARLIIVTAGVPAEGIAELQEHLRAGGAILCVMTGAGAGPLVQALMADGSLAVEEAADGADALLGDMAFDHPLFAPFNDPRFNDFTKIRFWRHRRVTLAAAPNVRIVARFDGGDPAIIEQERGAGRLLVMTSGWQPADSQLARSSKFVPLLAGILERSGIGEPARPQHGVGDTIALQVGPASAAPTVVRKPDGTEIAIPAGTRAFTAADVPGVYELIEGRRQFAINVPPRECMTAPLAIEDLEERGVSLDRRIDPAVAAERRRQLRDAELENGQKLWRWLLVAALGILVFETLLAGRASRKTAERAEVSP